MYLSRESDNYIIHSYTAGTILLDCWNKRDSMGTTNNSGYILKGFYYSSLAIHGRDINNRVEVQNMLHTWNTKCFVAPHCYKYIMMVVHMVRS